MNTSIIWIFNYQDKTQTILGALTPKQDIEIDRIINKINKNCKTGDAILQRQSFNQEISLNGQLHTKGNNTSGFKFVPANEIFEGLELIRVNFES